MKIAATLRVNGTDYPVELDPHVSLLKAVREELGLTGSKEGCDDSECGACMMLLDGEPVNACSYLALQAGVQCGFCTPGMLVSATALLRHSPDPTEEEIRIGLSGNLCRCTGYRGIVRAVRQVVSGDAPPLGTAPVHADVTSPHHAG